MKELDDRYYELQRRFIEIQKANEEGVDALRERLEVARALHEYSNRPLRTLELEFTQLKEIISAPKSYSEKLRDPRWQRKRLEIFQLDNWTCTECGDDKTCLQVHHEQYRRNTDPWEYPNELLRTLCEVCHERISL